MKNSVLCMSLFYSVFKQFLFKQKQLFKISKNQKLHPISHQKHNRNYRFFQSFKHLLCVPTQIQKRKKQINAKPNSFYYLRYYALVANSFFYFLTKFSYLDYRQNSTSSLGTFKTDFY